MNKGFSLIETLMVLVVFLVIAGGIATLMVSQSQLTSGIDTTERFFESMILPIDQFKRDASVATGISVFNDVAVGFRKGLRFSYRFLDATGNPQNSSIEYSHIEITPCFIRGLAFTCSQLRRRDVRTNSTVIFSDLLDLNWCVQAGNIGNCGFTMPGGIPTTLFMKRLSGTVLVLPQTFTLDLALSTPVQIRTQILTSAISIPFIIELENINQSGNPRGILAIK